MSYFIIQLAKLVLKNDIESFTFLIGYIQYSFDVWQKKIESTQFNLSQSTLTRGKVQEKESKNVDDPID